MPKDKQVQKPKGQPAKKELDKFTKPSEAFTMKKSWHGVEPGKGKDFDNSEWTW